MSDEKHENLVRSTCNVGADDLGEFGLTDRWDNSIDWVWYRSGYDTIGLDGDYSAEQLEAFAWWVRNHQEKR